MSAKELFQQYLGQCPLIAIIRGVTPDEADAIGDAIYESGIRIVEVPLNSPDPLVSIGRLASRLGERMLVGAGTVLTPDDVRRVGHAGGRLIVSPDTNGDVIAAHGSGGHDLLSGLFHAVRSTSRLFAPERPCSSSSPRKPRRQPL